MKVQSVKEAWSHHFRPGRSLGTSTDKGKKTGGFEGKRRNDKNPASAPQGALAGEATIHRRKRTHGTDRRAGFGDGTTSSENRAAAETGLDTKAMGRGERETERETRQRDRERGRETPAERPLEGPLGWKVAQRRWRQPERSGTRSRSREHESTAGEGGARRAPGRCKTRKEVGQGEEEARTEQRR